MKKDNPFPYSDDNKRYYTWNYYLKHTYHQKVFKVPLDAGFTCPNRDGTKGYGGCLFCGSAGSGECVKSGIDLQEQFEEGLAMMRKKWPTGKALAYFQAFTNTYGALEQLKACFTPFLERDDVIAICIATRADCISDEILSYLDEMCQTKDIWIELGLQSVYDETALAMNRGHTYEEFTDCIARLQKTHVKICVHLINGLPNETEEMMIHSAKTVGALPIHALKIHMLHLLKGTALYARYQEKPFPLLSQEEYVELVVKQLEVIDPHIIIQRLTGDGIDALLAAPLWTKRKVCVLNDIDKRMRSLNTWQGKKYK